MDTVGEEEPDPIKLKSVKNNKTFTVPQNDRVRELAPSGDKVTTHCSGLWFNDNQVISCDKSVIEHKKTPITHPDGLVRNSAHFLTRQQ